MMLERLSSRRRNRYGGDVVENGIGLVGPSVHAVGERHEREPERPLARSAGRRQRGTPWLWRLAFSHHEDRTVGCGADL
jgi:hypothetical protein